jgi:hypothetical protein
VLVGAGIGAGIGFLQALVLRGTLGTIAPWSVATILGTASPFDADGEGRRDVPGPDDPRVERTRDLPRHHRGRRRELGLVTGLALTRMLRRYCLFRDGPDLYRSRDETFQARPKSSRSI